MNNDANIARAMCLVPHHLMLAFMQGNHNKIIDDSNYWNLLGTAWKAGGSFEQQEQWIELFESKRRNRQKIMKTSERREFSRLPKVVTAYRAYTNEDELNHSICWSLDPAFVKQYAEKTGRKVAQMKFEKSNIFAYFNRRKESEILVWRGAA
ncbi:hypothetical protein [Acinetobacter sp. ANC 5378]|uniref:hypothetical protein n=1 Tax=Acinetobacter sp. ANC 5378 TaxID=2731249 RepID=UPI00148FD904|nr:hypothetical protein [Acinetobacter sp. ANC 5378]NNG80595.1 hypothetical protein [Acinetobacter sp. ANC 5378]